VIGLVNGTGAVITAECGRIYGLIDGLPLPPLLRRKMKKYFGDNFFHFYTDGLCGSLNRCLIERQIYENVPFEENFMPNWCTFLSQTVVGTFVSHRFLYKGGIELYSYQPSDCDFDPYSESETDSEYESESSVDSF